MNYDIKEIVSSARQISSNWYEQRNIILKFIDAIGKDYPNNVKVMWICDNQIRVIAFGYHSDVYFWWDGVDNEVIECCGLEKALGDPVNGNVRTSVLWCSDPEDKTPMIPRLPIKFR